MKWRCTWCGKPHADNDPPCDKCGHNVFEEAIVRVDESETDDELVPRTVDTGTTYVWRCPNCGRDHVRNNPPCSRCGNPDLEKTEQRYADVDRDLDVPGWVEVAKPYAPILVVVGIVALLFVTGTVPLSILPGIGTSSPPDAPGSGTEAAGLDLDETEREVHDRLEAERDAANAPSRSHDDGLGAYAEYLNRYVVAIEYEEIDPDDVDVPPLDEFDPDCGGDRVLSAPLAIGTISIDEYDDEGALADDIAAELLGSEFGDEVRAGFGAEGIDVHVALDDRVFVMYAAC
ncbi:hypothetical protein [Halosolutus gelatinilyticus]|uniref:hypothetical protein n=1 Tax=Halosolutus gelatinilyticus TaxID=2931975 RepID=UPI001FF106B0|nr:hypothetical protein [Halosolutus gelatinilyticus]